MIRDQFLLDLHPELIIDNFAGEEYRIADIGMRMLAPRELYLAQGFPENYIITHGIDANGKRIQLTKTAQVRMCGNSVCPPLSAALAKANVPELAAWGKTERKQLEKEAA